MTEITQPQERAESERSKKRKEEKAFFFPFDRSLAPNSLFLFSIPLISEARSEAWWQKQGVMPQESLTPYRCKA
jgi:hypothetical protein